MRHPIILALATSLALAAACRPAAAPGSAPGPAPGPAPAPAAASIPVESRVRVMLAGGADDGWLEGRWVVTSVGCQGVLLTEARLLVLLPALAAVERGGDGEGWQPVPLSRLRDGDGCNVAAPPSGQGQ
ncbi:MAG: hypothetical protein ACYC2G_05335 [Gemmatimonadaceae bacterium]